MTYIKQWSSEAQDDLRLVTEAVRRRIHKTASVVAAAPHSELARRSSVGGILVRTIEGTLLDMHYQPDIPSKTITITRILPQAEMYGDPYTDLV